MVHGRVFSIAWLYRLILAKMIVIWSWYLPVDPFCCLSIRNSECSMIICIYIKSLLLTYIFIVYNCRIKLIWMRSRTLLKVLRYVSVVVILATMFTICWTSYNMNVFRMKWYMLMGWHIFFKSLMCWIIFLFICRLLTSFS